MIRPLLRIDLLHELRRDGDPSVPIVERIYQILDEFYASASDAGLFFQAEWVAKVIESAVSTVSSGKRAPHFMWSAEGIYLSSLFEELVQTVYEFEAQKVGAAERDTGSTDYEVSRSDWARAMYCVRRNITAVH
ncbi:hypothetical protein [Sulfuriroseicoccus oceanibius]|uniref:Uncharacterized protein n=1 Tax=Sulfuriroseicoccus oceanibius TaxID=2707525 RepID=A0A6B3LCP6_9BACT|nr:hypothetical protein [Sulfuriroseicoccus oceanibius]QQL45120.1 hypothetical protein G3M56_000595 [Sulfuriroseicoccus oceanibius]